jgi:TonB-dependent receptor
LSTIISLSYANTWQYTSTERSRNSYVYDAPSNTYTPTKLFDYKFNQLQNNVRLGVIWNWALVLNSRNRLEFKNMFNENGLSSTTERSGAELYQNLELKDRALYYQQRGIYSGQFSGTHELKNERTSVNWTLGYSNIRRIEPNYRRGGYARTLGSNDDFKVIIPSQATDQDASRFDSKLSENIVAGTLNVEHQLTKSTEDKEGIKLRAGVYVEQRSRTFESRWMSFVIGNASGGNFNSALLNQPLETIFSEPNINAQTGFLLNEGTDGTNKYDASNKLIAGYIGATIPIGKLNISTGVRVEHNIQELNTKTQSNTPIKVNNPVTSVLPSLNVAYNFTKKMLVRAAFAQTINRPEFREIAPFGFYDFENSWKITGNPNLKVAQVNNYDLRWEYYPTANESISLGGFYKDFTNPIETYIEPQGTLDPAYYFGNAPKANCYGIEAEVRKSLNFISDQPVFEKFTVLLNASLIKSEVKLDESKLLAGQQSTRPLQGQSPYVVNAGLYYIDDVKQFQINVMYNVFGARLFGVGDKMFASVYQVERHVIDLTATKGFGKHFEMKAGIQDLLNQPFIMKEDSDRNYKKSAADQQVTSVKRGTYFTLGASYRF